MRRPCIVLTQSTLDLSDNKRPHFDRMEQDGESSTLLALLPDELLSSVISQLDDGRDLGWYGIKLTNFV